MGHGLILLISTISRKCIVPIQRKLNSQKNKIAKEVKMSRKSRRYNPEVNIEKVNELKFEICKIIDWELAHQRIAQRGLKACAFQLGTDPANVSCVVNKKVEQLTFNQLFRYLVVLRPDIRMMFSNY